jgi:hypothetical protein
MKRNKFIATLAALTALPALSFSQLKKRLPVTAKDLRLMPVKGGSMVT